MSIYNKLRDDINSIIKDNLIENKSYKKEIFQQYQIDEPPSEKFGDISTNVALVFSKYIKETPIDFANRLANKIKEISYIDNTKVEGPGFINLFLKKDFWLKELVNVLKLEKKYGLSNLGKGESVNVEFVSANPTGPLHIGHCRGAVYGDVLANLLSKVGYKVCKEYYINDSGNQIDILTETVFLRYQEIVNKKKIKLKEYLYPGEYLIPIAKDLKKKCGNQLVISNKKDFEIIKKHSLRYMMNIIKNDLNSLGIKFDNFISEDSLLKDKKIENVIDILKKKNLLYQGFLKKPKGKEIKNWESRKQYLFKSTKFGDDVDRPIMKSDNEYTYFLKDIAYHFDKFKRKFSFMINVWGADHGGYIKRLSSAVNSITNNKIKLIIKICQLVKVVDNKKILKMSKREGTYVFLDNIIKNIGKDVTRFIMLTRKNTEKLEFDVNKVKEESKDNPVFYVQYAHARCCSVLREAKNYFNNSEISLKNIKKNNFNLINNSYELDLIKFIGKWPKIIEDASVNQEPHRIPFYLQALASKFHTLWNYGKQNTNLRFINSKDKNLTFARLGMIYSLKIILSNGLKILGIKPLEVMK